VDLDPAAAGSAARERGSVPAVLVETAGQRPDETALIAERHISYAELLSLVSQASTHLLSLGVRAGDRVAIAAGSTPDHVATWYAVLGLGAISVELNFLLADAEWERILANCAPVVVVAEERFLSRLRAVATPETRVESIATSGAEPGSVTWSPRAVQSSDPAVIAYTSGTTGLPKGVVHTHGAIAAQLSLLQREVGYDSSWVVYQSTPLFSLPGFLPQVATTLHVGATALLADKFDPAAFAEASRRYPISYTVLSSPMVPRLLTEVERGGLDLSHLKVLSCGGAPLHPEVAAEFRRIAGVPLTEGYAMTEMIGAFVMDLGGDAPWGASGRIYPRGADVLCILNDADEPVAHNEIGEIAVQSDYVAKKYWPTQALELSGGRWFRTGDIGRIDDDGFLFLLDRKKDVIIRGGFNIYSAEIERVLVADPRVAEATVIGVPDSRVGEVPVAFVVLADHVAGDALEGLLADVTEILGRLKRPEAIHAVQFDELPRNALGKVQKATLRAAVVEFSQPER
jgi:acyl-CoA synthetase (AMP-forming)/AMP-acid ligase II